MNTRTIILASFTFLTEKEQFQSRGICKDTLEYTRDNLPLYPYPNKIHFTVSLTGLFHNITALNDAWEYYQAIVNFSITKPAVLYRLDDYSATNTIKTRSVSEGDLKNNFIVYKPGATHFWNKNLVFMLAHMHYHNKGNAFTILSPIILDNFVRRKNTKQVSAFGREIHSLLSANYTLQWDDFNKELLLTPTQDFRLPAQNGMNVFLNASDSDISQSLYSFFNQKNEFVLKVIIEKITKLNELVDHKILELRTLNDQKTGSNQVINDMEVGYPAEDNLQSQGAKNSLENDEVMLNEIREENSYRQKDPSLDVVKRIKLELDTMYQLQHEIENFVEGVCSDLYLFCLSPHINVGHVYFQLIKTQSFASFEITFSPKEMMNLEGTNDERTSALVAIFQGYLLNLILTAVQHQNECAMSGNKGSFQGYNELN